MNHRILEVLTVSACLACTLAGCAGGTQDGTAASTASTTQAATQASTTQVSTSASASSAATTQQATTQTAAIPAAAAGGVIDGSTLFTERDLEQTADTTGAQTIQLADGSDVQIASEGVYVIQGSASEATIYVDADDQAKVQLVFDGASISNTGKPAVYVRSADKVFITTTNGTSTLAVTGTFEADGDTNVDGVVFSKDDVVLNGTGTLNIESSANGIVSKDDLKVTGGTYRINATGHALDANDSIAVAAGTFDLTAGTDGLHADNDEDDSVGYVYIADGALTIAAGSDAIEGTSVVQIDGGSLAINSAEGIEGTYVQINGGSIDVNATDDGINASLKSTAYPATIEITGGEVAVTMAAGDTDAFDSNGDLVVSGGTIDINAQFAFDFVGQATFTGGTITVNGQQVTEITNSMMEGGMGGGRMGGMMPDQGGMPPAQGGGQPA